MSRRRGYRELQADAARGTVTCPHCHSTFAPGEAEQTALVPALPDGFPVLSAELLAARVAENASKTARLHEALRERVGDSTHGQWLASLRLVGASGGTLYALVAADGVEWVRSRFALVLNEAASALAGRPVEVVVGGAS